VKQKLTVWLLQRLAAWNRWAFVALLNGTYVTGPTIRLTLAGGGGGGGGPA